MAAATAVVGVAAIKQVQHPRELPLAIVPLLFAFQQTAEGVLWLQLSGAIDGVTVAAFSFAYLLIAKVIWPTYSPLAVLLIEPDRHRRRILGAIAVTAAALSIYLLIELSTTPPTIGIRNHSIDYGGDVNALSWQLIPYLLCTCGALLLSSHRIIQALGAIVVVGFLVSAYIYFATYISVWCFFAAAGSLLVYFYFRRSAATGTALQHR